ncbi:copper resistance protein B [Sphingomonas psychrotolerans]|uniref:Copper resistance protein CopB n=1 Tax=Sphingomonas psychrotolerans TaxID=1327635 RepID=A0A2K8MHV5_9SPHN|nr:copper resistance protein B [Sphingomonas psychrotolerans]ATY33465.1 copper resistance protein CopB [Sphingomonas psychrotolerans]
MRTMLFLLGPLAFATPAFAQHSGHAATAQPAAAIDPSCPPEHAAMGHCTPRPAGTASGQEPGVAGPPVAPPSARALGGPMNAADQVYGTDAMADARAVLRKEHGDIVTSKVLIDRVEAGFRQGHQSYAWEAQGWYGGDVDRFWIKSEGEGTFSEAPDTAKVQALYSRAIDPWFNLQAGLRQDLAGPDRTHFVLGLQGLAPYWFDVAGALFLSTKGDLTGRFEAEYDQRLTRKLTLQPNLEFDLAAQDVPELGIGAGLSTAEAGLRLRYALIPEFAPYIGIKYERAFGRTRDLARARGDTEGFSFLIGLRTWF